MGSTIQDKLQVLSLSLLAYNLVYKVTLGYLVHKSLQSNYIKPLQTIQ